MMRSLLVVIVLISLAGPLPPLLPKRPGPATYAQYRARCSATISPSAWPVVCLRGRKGQGWKP